MEQQNPPVEESIFNEADYSMEGYDKHVRHARITLYVLAGFFLLTIFIFIPIDTPAKWATVGVMVLFAIVFVILGLWSRNKPYPAILTALIIFVALQTLNVILEPATLLQAWYIKIAVILFLIMGLRNAKEIRDRKKAFGEQG